MMTVEVCRTLGGRAADWDALVDRMDHPSPFLRSWWLEAISGPGAALVLAIDDAGPGAGQEGFEHRVVGGADADRAIATFEDLHQLRWGRDSVVAPALGALSDALRAGAERGEVAFQEVVVGDRVVASLVAFEIVGISSWYQMGRDPDRAWSNCGTFLKAKAVDRSCRLGHSRIDMCIGTARQKVEWSDGQQPVVRVRWARGTAGRAVLSGLVASGHLAEAARARRATAP